MSSGSRNADGPVGRFGVWNPPVVARFIPPVVADVSAGPDLSRIRRGGIPGTPGMDAESVPGERKKTMPGIRISFFLKIKARRQMC